MDNSKKRGKQTHDQEQTRRLGSRDTPRFAAYFLAVIWAGE
jgi:hypothetical protein